jgi:hypothetical protein
MQSFIIAALFSAVLLPLGSSAVAQPSTDSLIGHSLDWVDYPAYEPSGPLPAMKPRLGIYMRDISADSVRKLTHGLDSVKGAPIWHVAPHWSADEAGLLMNDVVLRVDGKSLMDSVYGPDDVLNTRLRDYLAGETMHFKIVRDGVVKEIPVKLTSGKRAPMQYIDYPELGPLRHSWMQRTLAEKKLTDWADTIAKQIASIADLDFCDLPFADRPSPFRLNAVTYLDHHPTRVGALSRLIDKKIWGGVDSFGIGAAVSIAGIELGTYPLAMKTPVTPKTESELVGYLALTQSLISQAYSKITVNLDSLSYGLSQLLNTDTNWEDPVDTTKDPVQQLRVRNGAEKQLSSLLSQADKLDMTYLTLSAGLLCRLADTSWLRTFATQYANTKPLKEKVPGVDGDVVAVWNTPVGRCVIGGKGRNRYYGDFAFILDLGGDDIYELPPCKPGHMRFVADMSGDDIYRGAQSAASGVGCVDVLADLAGNDFYQGARWSQGAGCLGVGVLADYGGDDIYTSHWASQGAAMLGIGLLYDHAGSDHYSADVYAQGFAYTKGFGMLLDRAGNDAYRAGWKYPDDRWPNRAHVSMSQGFGFGMRPWSTGIGTDGGIGLLSDRQGDDTYDADYFSQGGSYWYALGILHDWQGADRYNAGQYSQGSGIHLSFGALLDDSGDDSYDAYAWLEQGNAHDWSSGALEDWSGNDTYRSSGASQGCGFFVSFAYLLDSHGDDRYYLKPTDTTNSQGGGNFIAPRHSGSLGMLIDLGHGDDYYFDPRITPGKAIVKSERGVAYDDGVPEKK